MNATSTLYKSPGQAAASSRPGTLAALGMALFMAVLIYIRHKDNIGRLLKGEEPRIGAKKNEAP